MRRRQQEDLDEVFVRANRLLESGHNTEAYSLFLQAAELGHSHSQHNVALLLETGLGTEMNKAAAIRWYVRSWRLNPQSSTAENLAMLYADLGNRDRERFWRARSTGAGKGGAK
jgi:TPR repeat protein